MLNAKRKGLLQVILLPGVTALFWGCVSYQAKPLDERSLDQFLAPPNQHELTQQAAHPIHPRLAPLILDFSQPLSEEALGVMAVLANPDIKALREREKVADAQVFAAGLLPDPQLAAGLDFPLARGAGVVSPYSLGLSWDISKLITRRADQRVAEAEAQQVRFDVAWQEWLLANKARLLARRASYLESQEVLARRAAEIAGTQLEMTRRNLNEGNVTIDILGLRLVASSDAQDRALALARELEKTRQELNRTLGLPPAERISIAPSVFSPLPDLSAEDLFASARRQRLDLIALRAGYTSQEARLYRAILGQYPRFTLGLNHARDSSDVRTVGTSVSFDIPLLNRNRGNIEIAETTREQLHTEYGARLYQTRADTAAILADLKRIAEEQAPLMREVPELARAEKVLRAGVTNGDVTLVEYETVRASLLDKQLKLASLEQAASEQQIALQIAVGAPVVPSGVESP